MTGLTRQQAAEAVAALFGTSARQTHESTTYDPWEVIDRDGKKWRFVFDSSIKATMRDGRRQIPATSMGKLQEVVRTLRHAGAVVNGSCGMHVHVDASRHTPQSLKNALSIMYSKEDILFKALNVNEARVERWCQKVREPMLEKIRKLPTNISMERLKREWYGGNDGSYEHYNWTRYYALNLHSVFYRGTLEWRCFESTLHAGKVRANITLALAISAQAINQKKTLMRKTEISENPAFTFRTFLLRLGLIGPEYKNVREHLLANLPGDKMYIAGGVGDNMTYSARYKAGLMAGVDIDWQFMPNLSATIGAQYVQQGAKYGNDGYKVQVTEGVYKGTGYSDWSTQLHYINVPLMLNAYLGTGFAVKAGVQIGFPLSGKMKYTEQQYTMTKDDVKYEKPEHVKYDLNSTLTKVTFAIPVGVSYEFSNVIIDARYNIGLTQFQNIDGFDSSKNSVFAFSVAYRLEL